MEKPIRIAVFGATGSVGGAVLDVCRRFPDKFDVRVLAACSSKSKLLELAQIHRASKLALTEPAEDFNIDGYECMTGESSLSELASDPEIDHIVFAASGVAAIKALQTALISNKDVSLANKESIVAAGPWVMPLIKRKDQLRPIDSEHSAIWQCLRDTPENEVKKIWLTASGGPFRNYSEDDMKKVTPELALNHPIWKMGAKITIDSATLMNKGIECIEAMRLFNLQSEKVDAVIHPKSQAHGMVLFCDGTMKMLLSSADMRLPSAAAIAWPNRLPLIESGFNFPPTAEWDLSFKKIDRKLFPCFRIAQEAGRLAGAYPSLLIGADEAAVRNFLKGNISFTDIPKAVEETLSKWNGIPPATADDAIAVVKDGERLAEAMCKNWRHSC